MDMAIPSHLYSQPYGISPVSFSIPKHIYGCVCPVPVCDQCGRKTEGSQVGVDIRTVAASFPAAAIISEITEITVGQAAVTFFDTDEDYCISLPYIACIVHTSAARNRQNTSFRFLPFYRPVHLFPLP